MAFNRSLSVSLLVFTDGREAYLRQTMQSFYSNARGEIMHKVMIDDSGSENYAEMLDRVYSDFIIAHHERRMGFGAAIQSGWRHLPPCDYVFHLEDDFTFNRTVDLNALVSILAARPDIIQVVLKRQPWNPQERKAGGIIEMYPKEYEEKALNGWKYVEHEHNFSTNPCLYPYWMTQRFAWPSGFESEGHFGIELREHGYKFAYFGGKADAPLVTHIGVNRAGNGY